jgi:hypothetical protein
MYVWVPKRGQFAAKRKLGSAEMVSHTCVFDFMQKKSIVISEFFCLLGGFGARAKIFSAGSIREWLDKPR